MSRWVSRLATLGLSFALVGALSGPSVVPSSALPLAPQLSYDKPTEGLSLLYPAIWPGSPCATRWICSGGTSALSR